MELSAEQQIEAIHLALQGHTLQHICDCIFVQTYEFYDYRLKHTQFALEFARALHEGLDIAADQLRGITERIPDVMKARLESENLRWILSKKKPTVYGDKLELTGSVQLSLGDALRDAKARALPIRDLNTAPQLESGEIPQLLPQSTAGCQPASGETVPNRAAESSVAAPRHKGSKIAGNRPPPRSNEPRQVSGRTNAATPQKAAERTKAGNVDFRQGRATRRPRGRAKVKKDDENPFL